MCDCDKSISEPQEVRQSPWRSCWSTHHCNLLSSSPLPPQEELEANCRKLSQQLSEAREENQDLTEELEEERACSAKRGREGAELRVQLEELTKSSQELVSILLPCYASSVEWSICLPPCLSVCLSVCMSVITCLPLHAFLCEYNCAFSFRWSS